MEVLCDIQTLRVNQSPKSALSSSGSFNAPEISELLFFALMWSCMAGRINTWSNKNGAYEYGNEDEQKGS